MDMDERDFVDLLRHEPSAGKIFLKDYRMVMYSACALGALRKELIETLGWEQTRGLLKRFGYAAGIADAKALAERFPEAEPERQMVFGPLLHAVEGAARMERIPDRSQVDLRQGIYHVEGYWLNSFEAEQHLEEFGPSPEPVCWNLAGYATGHSTFFAGRPAMAVEQECRAMGHERCRFVVDFTERYSSEFDLERRDYEALRLPDVLRELKDTIESQRDRLRQRDRTIEALHAKLKKRENLGGMLGESSRLKRALAMAERAAPVDSTVLILGESGVGKELLARGIHQKSRRADKPFLPVNCSALPENMQEAELFGWARGAFTGATASRAGVFESAHGGTLFLDEIGDLSLAAQTKILRALQEGEVKRLGENRIRKVDVRILAATHQDLERMAGEKAFRQDLFYRLDVVRVHLPPLRDRDNDALLLANQFAREFAQRFEKPAIGLDGDALRAIAAYRWPGNVRELRHAIERAVILATGPRIGRRDLPERVAAAPEAQPGSTGAEPAARGDDERSRIEAALRRAGGRRLQAARLLGMSRATLWRRMKKLGMLGR